MSRQKRPIVYPVLEVEIFKRRIIMKDMAERIGINPGAFRERLNGKRSFKLEEALAIQKIWFPDIPIQELFRYNEKEDPNATK